MAIRGYVDGVVGGEIVGWAADDERPGARIEVSGRFDHLPLPAVPADQERDDLRRAGLGDGAHGFRIPLEGDALTAGAHIVEVRAGSRTLPLAPDWVVQGRGDEPLDDVSLAVPDGDGPTHALAGRAGWLFGVGAGDLELRCGTARVSHASLDAEVAELELLATTVSDFCCALVPDKLQVYPEHAPQELVISAAGRGVRLLNVRLDRHGQRPVLDLLPVLEDARYDGRVFPRTGDALSWVGAFHVYRAVARSVGLDPLPVSALDLGPHEPVATRLDLLPRLRHEADALVPAEPDTAVDDLEPTLVPLSIRAARSSALVVHDPVAARVVELLSGHFRQVEVEQAPAVDIERIRREPPEVLIWLRADC